MADSGIRRGKWVECTVCGKRIWKEQSRLDESATGQFTCSRAHWKIAHKRFWENWRKAQ